MSAHTPEVYVSTDIESDGPIPGPHSLLSFASAAFSAEGPLIATYSANLELLPGASMHPDTAAFWQANPEAWQSCRTSLRPPEVVLPEYVSWLKRLPGKPVFVGYPASFDFLFVYWYLIRFAGESPFSFAALDIKTYAMALLKRPYRACAKRNLPERWRSTRPHTHVALDDALEQGELFGAMLRENSR